MMKMKQSIKQYTVLIVDDEPHVLEGMKMMVDWDQLQCGQIYYCESSEEAHIVMKTHHIDVLITDIRLPGENGLDLAQSVKARFKDIKILVMSGYRDFEYVKKAMTLGVDGYIVKPVFEEEVYEAVKPLIEEMNKTIAIRSYSETSTLFIIKRNLVNPCPLDDQNMRVVSYLKTNDFFLLTCWNQKEGFCKTLVKEIIAYENVEDKGVILYSDHFGVICLMKESISRQWVDILAKTEEHVAWERTEIINTLEDLKCKFTTFKTILPKLCHYLKGEHILDRHIEKKEGFIDNQTELYKKVKTDIVENEGKLLLMYSENLFFILSARCMHLDDIKKHIIDFYYQLVMDLQFLLEKEKNLEKYRVLPDNLSDGTAETLINFFESRIIEMMHISKKGRKKCKKNLICQVEQMMIENLQENITLKDLSKKVHLHPAYLGQKLFDYWGESFQRRLNRMRIEKAIELLSNEEWNLAIEESAYRVGYKNYITFLKYFKLFYGTIPREYIEKNKN